MAKSKTTAKSKAEEPKRKPLAKSTKSANTTKKTTKKSTPKTAPKTETIATKAPTTLKEEKKCTCTIAQKTIGDGCEICNPTRALEIAKERIKELEVERDWVRVEDDPPAHGQRVLAYFQKHDHIEDATFYKALKKDEEDVFVLFDGDSFEEPPTHYMPFFAPGA